MIWHFMAAGIVMILIDGAYDTIRNVSYERGYSQGVAAVERALLGAMGDAASDRME